ncbi:MAG: antitoxin, partial [Kineosporiaceae bacterium]|nr:antitoxin [Aeromicrobium sp.]
MPTIQVRDIPQDAYDVIVARAKANGQSIQQYMRAMITDVAAKPSKAEA